ncbi:MAG: membrane metalloprotease [Flavobacteriaceae bacterium]|nr:membrane metalloprotease [Flavobacteriaceae bacterium]
MKNILKGILLICLLISCTKDDNPDQDSNNPANYPYLQQVGYSAKDILSSTTFSNIYIEVMYVDGFKPSDQALNNLRNFINQRTFKSTVTIEKKLISTPTAAAYSINDIRKIEDDNRSKFSSGNQIVIVALFLNGESSNNSGNSVVLGTAYRNTSFVIFEESIHSFSNSPFKPAREVLESAVILHEFCHLLGLVNLGTAMVNNHEDSAHSAHCTTQNCLMYYKVENGNGVIDMISGGQIPQLDSFCIGDLKANGGK